MMSGTLFLALIPVLLVFGADAWVFTDARDRLGRGDRVAISLGTFRVDTPQMWFLGCLILWVVFFPLYLTATGRNPFARRRV